jgi:hypothetical protein
LPWHDAEIEIIFTLNISCIFIKVDAYGTHRSLQLPALWPHLKSLQVTPRMSMVHLANWRMQGRKVDSIFEFRAWRRISNVFYTLYLYTELVEWNKFGPYRYNRTISHERQKEHTFPQNCSAHKTYMTKKYLSHNVFDMYSKTSFHQRILNEIQRK